MSLYSFILLVILLNLLLQRSNWLQHGLLFVVTFLVVFGYVLVMHYLFGKAYDAATLDQVYRTLGKKAAPGLNDGPLTALQAFLSTYWMFFITLTTLVCGFFVSFTRYFQALCRRKKIAQPLLVSWALSGMLFAAAISLKSPHYLMLWIVPLYAILAQELGRFIQSWNWHILLPKSRPRHMQALSFLVPFALFFLLAMLWGFKLALCMSLEMHWNRLKSI